MSRLLFPARDRFNDLWRWVETGLEVELGHGGMRPGELLRSVVPGWAHWYRGETRRAAAFLGVWLMLLAATVITIGSTASAIALGLALSVHVGSFLNRLWRDQEVDFRRRLAVSALFFGLGAFIYISAAYQSFRVLEPYGWNIIAEPFSPGDVILCNHRAYLTQPPVAGDVVLFRLGLGYGPRGPRRFDGRNVVFQGSGPWVDRILAGPGSDVEWNGEKLLVNGQPSEFRPLNSGRMPPRFAIKVPLGGYCILPSTVPGNQAFGLAQNVPEVPIVPIESIVGRAVMRNYPLTRWWWIR